MILTVGASVVQLVGMVREFIVAARVGVSGEYDALLVATVLPGNLADILTIGLATALVPGYLEARRTSGRSLARAVSGSLLAWVSLAGFALMLLVYGFADVIISITGPGLSAQGHDAAVEYLRLLAPASLVLGVNAILYAVTQAEQRFVAIATAGLAMSLTSLGALLIFWDSLGLKALILGGLVGPVATLAVLMLTLARARALPYPTFRIRGLGLRQIGDHALPLSISAAVGQLQMLTDRAIATLMGEGSLSLLRYGEVLVRTPITAVRGAWGSALYPALVHAAQDDTAEGIARATERSLRWVLIVFIPVSVLTAAVAPVAVQVAFGRGAFGPEAVMDTATVVAAFAPIVVISMAAPVLRGAHNARRRGRVLLGAGITNAILNLVFDVVFGLWLGAAGIALSSAVTTLVVLIYLAWKLKETDPTFEPRPLLGVTGRSLVASVPGAVVVAAIAWGDLVPAAFLPGLLALVVFGIGGVASYVVLSPHVGLLEPMLVTRSLAGRVALIRRRG